MAAVTSPTLALALSLFTGDANVMFSGSVGGNDTLISGTTTDLMHGDAASMTNDCIGGADTFLFLANNYTDTIFDFRSSDGDKVDLTALNIESFGALEAHMSIQDGSEYGVEFNTLIDLGAAAGGAAGVDTLTVVGISNLQATDFQLLG